MGIVTSKLISLHSVHFIHTIFFVYNCFSSIIVIEHNRTILKYNKFFSSSSWLLVSYSQSTSIHINYWHNPDTIYIYKYRDAMILNTKCITSIKVITTIRVIGTIRQIIWDYIPAILYKTHWIKILCSVTDCASNLKMLAYLKMWFNRY